MTQTYTDVPQQLAEKVKTRESEKESIQGELDDIYMVYADAEEKLNKYKARLKEKGEAITDDEEEEEGDDDEDEDEDEGEKEEGNDEVD